MAKAPEEKKQDDKKKVSGLRSFFSNLWNTAEDFASLDVVTLSGRIELQTAGGAGPVDILTDGELDSTKLRKQIATQLTVNADMRVVGMTHIAFDKDSVEFVDEEALGNSKAETHHANVETAIKSREAIWQMIVDAVKGGVSFLR